MVEFVGFGRRGLALRDKFPVKGSLWATVLRATLPCIPGDRVTRRRV